MAFEKDPNELGALWHRDGRKGPFLTGQIEGIGDVICFPINSNNPKAPTWRVLRSTPREDRQAPTPQRDDVPLPTDDDFDIGF